MNVFVIALFNSEKTNLSLKNTDATPWGVILRGHSHAQVITTQNVHLGVVVTGAELIRVQVQV